MTNDEVYVGALGLEITLHTYVDLSTAATTLIKVLSPSGATCDWDATVDGTNDLVYTTEDGNLDESGTYYLQAYAAWGNPLCNEHRGKTVELEVLENFST